MAGKLWTDNENEILRKHYPFKNAAALQLLLNRSDKAIYSQANILGLSKDENYLQSEECGRIQKSNSGQRGVTRFKKGHTPWNKNLKGLQIGGIQTQFKKGNIPPNTKEKDGVIVTRCHKKDKRSYNYIRVSLGKWELCHRYYWRLKYGSIPKGMILACRSSDPLNYDPDNWELITRSENMRRNSYHFNYPKEIANAIQLKGALQRQINKAFKKLKNEK